MNKQEEFESAKEDFDLALKKLSSLDDIGEKLSKAKSASAIQGIYFDMLSGQFEEIEAAVRGESLNLEGSIKYLGRCYSLGYSVKRLLEGVSKAADVNSSIKFYTDWFKLTAGVLSAGSEIRAYYLEMFLNHHNKDEGRIPLSDDDGEYDALNIEGLPIQPIWHAKRLGRLLERLEEIIFRLEEKQNVAIQHEIAKRQHDNSFRYWLEYREMSGKLYLNDTLVLASPRIDSPGEKLLEQAFESPNTKIKIEGVTQSQISSALRDMNIKGTIKDIFFPRTSNKHILFRPSITNSEFIQEGLQDIDFKDFEK